MRRNENANDDERSSAVVRVVPVAGGAVVVSSGRISVRLNTLYLTFHHESAEPFSHDHFNHTSYQATIGQTPLPVSFGLAAGGNTPIQRASTLSCLRVTSGRYVFVLQNHSK